MLTKLQPNLQPPITSTERAIEYQNQLRLIDPEVEYLMTLYLCPEITPEEIRKASKAGIVGGQSSAKYSSFMYSRMIIRRQILSQRCNHQF